MELLRSNTPKVIKLEGKKGGAAPEQLRSGSRAAPEQLRSREEQGGAEEMDKKKWPKTKTFLRNIFEIVIEFSFKIANFILRQK